tara:strand:+ start:416 stop:1033 length:618 start_codon:yes stop_codon:yes gene_type:complete
MEITKTIPIDDTIQRVLVTITHGDDSYGYDANTPVLEGDELQAHCDANEFKWLNNILYQVYGRNIQFESIEKWDEWIAAGCKLEEITTTTVTPAQPAVDAVMGERQVVVESEVEEEVSTTEIVEVDGKFVEKTTTETVTKTVSTPQVTKHKLYNDAGEEIGEHEVATMESYEVTPAVAAVAEQSETVVTRAESVVEKVAWKDTAE